MSIKIIANLTNDDVNDCGGRIMVLSFAINSNGTILATANSDGTVKVWNMQNSTSTSTLCHNDYVHDPKNPDDWEVCEFDSSRRIPVQRGLVTSIAFHPTDPLMMATGSDDMTARLWRLTLMNPNKEEEGGEGEEEEEEGWEDTTMYKVDGTTVYVEDTIEGMAFEDRAVFNADGYLGTLDEFREIAVKVRAKENGSTSQYNVDGNTVYVEDPREGLAFDDRRVFSDQLGDEQIGNLANLREIAKTVLAKEEGTTLYKVDGYTFYVADPVEGVAFDDRAVYDTERYLGNLANLRVIAKKVRAKENPKDDATSSSSSSSSWGEEGQVDNWGMPGAWREGGGWMNEDEHTLAWGEEMKDGVYTPMHLATLRHRKQISSIAFNSTGAILATSYVDSYEEAPKRTSYFDWSEKVSEKVWCHGGVAKLKLWHTSSYECVGTMNIPHKIFAYSPVGSFLATGDYDETVKLRSVKTYDCLRTLLKGSDVVKDPLTNKYSFKKEPDLNREITCIAFNSTGTLLAAGIMKSPGQPSVCKLWDMRTYECVATLDGADEQIVRSIAFHPSAPFLAINTGLSVKLWDTKSGNCMVTLKNPDHDDRLYPYPPMAFNPTGTILFTVGGPSVHLWDCSILSSKKQREMALMREMQSTLARRMTAQMPLRAADAIVGRAKGLSLFPQEKAAKMAAKTAKTAKMAAKTAKAAKAAKASSIGGSVTHRHRKRRKHAKTKRHRKLR
jgi:WD40 repeat protein